jgi:3-hydroxyacyl-[acyl-carrier-protein] dehydratase
MADGKRRIDRLRGADGGLDRHAIRSILPYGDDFLFVDRAPRLSEREIETCFRIPARAPYLDGHFRGLPVMPGALMSEAFAQAGAILVRYNLESPEAIDIVGHHVESARFLSLALPGDLLQFNVRLETLSRRAARLAGGAWVGEREVGRMRVVVAIMPRQALRQEVEKLKRTAPTQHRVAAGETPLISSEPQTGDRGQEGPTTMSRDQLHEPLERLRAEIKQLGDEDEAIKQRMKQLVADLERKLDSEDSEHEPQLIEGLRSSIESFEVEYPRLTAALNRIMVSLSNIGI